MQSPVLTWRMAAEPGTPLTNTRQPPSCQEEGRIIWEEGAGLEGLSNVPTVPNDGCSTFFLREDPNHFLKKAHTQRVGPCHCDRSRPQERALCMMLHNQAEEQLINLHKRSRHIERKGRGAPEHSQPQGGQQWRLSSY